MVDAVSCLIEVQAAMASKSADVTEDRSIVFRVGINIGNIIIDAEAMFQHSWRRTAGSVQS